MDNKSLLCFIPIYIFCYLLDWIMFTHRLVELILHRLLSVVIELLRHSYYGWMEQEIKNSQQVQCKINYYFINTKLFLF
jgi:hypothetical protein